ncbi:MAG: isoprenyl transferase [Bdellovibrionales bacterium]
MNLPTHLAIIMDGNGRWAKARKHQRIYGHVRGAQVAKSVITRATEVGLKYLTLYAFSTENWLRPESEVSFLMRLLGRQITKELNLLIKNNIQFRVIGDVSKLPPFVQGIVQNAVLLTKNNTGMVLTFALSFGGRQEITEAVKSIANKVLRGDLAPEQINESLIAAELNSSFLPDPDLILRTSGEHRISNFFLWQTAYSEIYFIKKFWPDFSISDFNDALTNFNTTERRFGRINNSTATNSPQNLNT